MGDKGLISRPKAEDKIFSTAVALNALMDLNTVPTQGGKRIWSSTAKSTTISYVQKGIAWLNGTVLGDTWDHENAFFSNDVKGIQGLPYWYPANRSVFHIKFV